MKRKDLLELKKRFKKESCTFTRMTGCYVNSNKEKVVTLNEVFLNLPDEEFYKYLDIAKKALSGTMGNNLLELGFIYEEDEKDSKQRFYYALEKSGLKEEGLLDRFYDLVIENYDYPGNYLILLFHDAYDVMTKTEDNQKLDESEEVYEYIVCAICPVTLSKPGLGYLEEENKIGVRLRDWIVGAPENGFLFPAFTDRSSDIHALLYYAKNAKDPKESFMESTLGCSSRRTSVQQKKSFENVIKKAVAGTEEISEDVFISIQETLCDRIEQKEAAEKDPDPIELTTETFKEILQDCELSEELAPKLEKAFAEEFGEEIPTADALLDTKALAKNEQKKKEKELVCEVANLKEALAQVKNSDGSSSLVDTETGEIVSEMPSMDGEEGVDANESNNALLCDVFLRVKPEKASRITSKVIDGQTCLIIPVEESDDIDINGLKTLPN